MIEIKRLGFSDETLIEHMKDTFFADHYQAVNLTALSDPHHFLYYAYLDGEIAGFLLGYRLDRPDTSIPVFFLYEIEVLEQFQRRGVGVALLERFKSETIAAGGNNYFVLTNASNIPAMGMYVKAGGVSHFDDVVMFDFDFL